MPPDTLVCARPPCGQSPGRDKQQKTPLRHPLARGFPGGIPTRPTLDRPRAASVSHAVSARADSSARDAGGCSRKQSEHREPSRFRLWRQPCLQVSTALRLPDTVYPRSSPPSSLPSPSSASRRGSPCSLSPFLSPPCRPFPKGQAHVAVQSDATARARFPAGAQSLLFCNPVPP